VLEASKSVLLDVVRAVLIESPKGVLSLIYSMRRRATGGFCLVVGGREARIRGMDEADKKDWPNEGDSDRLRDYLRDERDTVWKLKKEMYEFGVSLCIFGAHGVALMWFGGRLAGMPVAWALSILLIVGGGYMWWKSSRP
jgi:hypothetical protein